MKVENAFLFFFFVIFEDTVCLEGQTSIRCLKSVKFNIYETMQRRLHYVVNKAASIFVA